ncbi:MAG: MiaB/RimO family radical SAM methylthiotransferase [bacterium]|nr:MiaB/RimO family radical SAM methylthiotransferase [bacterium]
MKVSFITFGCRLNQYKTEWLREEFEIAGFKVIPHPCHSEQSEESQYAVQDRLREGEESHHTRQAEDVDVCVINTCAVTAHAAREARNIIRTYSQRGKNSKPPNNSMNSMNSNKPFIIVTGCYAKVYQDEIKSIKGVNLIEPDYKKIVTDFLKVPILQSIKKFADHTKAFVKVQEGCDQFCSYCIVPYARGAPKSRPIEEIIAEVNALIANGYEEFVLTGTNLSKCDNLLGIIKSISQIHGVHWLGIGSIEPLGISDEFLDYIGSGGLINQTPTSKFYKYIHLPLQSGDNSILKLMNRWYTAEEYEDLIYKIKEKIPSVAIGADVIVGFPGEGETEFANTYDLIQRSPISRLHVFRYSKRPGTKAANFKNEVPEKTKKERSRIIRELGDKKWEAFREQFIGKTLEAHIESKTIEAWYSKPTSHPFAYRHTEGRFGSSDPNTTMTSSFHSDHIPLSLRAPAKQSHKFSEGEESQYLLGVTQNYIKVLFKSNLNLTKRFVNLRIKKIVGPKTYGELVSGYMSTV